MPLGAYEKIILYSKRNELIQTKMKIGQNPVLNNRFNMRKIISRMYQPNQRIAKGVFSNYNSN